MSRAHPKLCQCKACVQRRFELAAEGVEAFAKATGAKPSSPEQTVRVSEYRVRAHFRRNPRHMNKDPKVRGLLERYLSELAKKT